MERWLRQSLPTAYSQCLHWPKSFYNLMYSQKNDLNTLLWGCKLTIIPFSEKIFFALILGFKNLILNTFNRLLEQTLMNVARKNCIY